MNIILGSGINGSCQVKPTFFVGFMKIGVVDATHYLSSQTLLWLYKPSLTRVVAIKNHW
jgi:hypothetical protein